MSEHTDWTETKTKVIKSILVKIFCQKEVKDISKSDSNFDIIHILCGLGSVTTIWNKPPKTANSMIHSLIEFKK